MTEVMVNGPDDVYVERGGASKGRRTAWELRGRIKAQERQGRPRAGEPGRPTKRLAAVAMLAALVLVGSIVLPADGPAGPDPAVADVLRRFSRIAASAPAEQPPQPGQYVYWKTTDVTTYLFFSGPELKPFAYRISGVQERWLGLDGSGRSVYEVGQPEFLRRGPTHPGH